MSLVRLRNPRAVPRRCSRGCVDGFGRTVAGVGMIEVGQDVPGSAFECPAQRDELGEAPRYACGGQCIDFGLHQGLTADFVGITIGAR